MNNIIKEISQSWERICQREKEIKELKEKIIELENAIQKESESNGFVFNGIKILNEIIEIENQLDELEKELKNE